MSQWRDQRNAEALRRLRRAMPEIFPTSVLVHAEGQRFVPPLPRQAVESYWRAHPLRADRLARALAARSGAPSGWRWLIDRHGEGAAQSFRAPPAPYREAAHARGPGSCCACGQPVFRFGWHVDLWDDRKPNRRAAWHACCVAAWKLWTAPNAQRGVISRLQKRRCATTGGRLLKTAEVDHRVPLFKVWRDHRETPWPDLLGFWGFPNLQALNRPAHVSKTAAEAGERTRRESDSAPSLGPAPYPSARVRSPDWRFSGRGMPTILNPAST